MKQNSNTATATLQAEKLAQLSFMLARACEDKEQYFTKLFDLTNAEFRCMRFLDCHCEYYVKDIAALMGLSSGRITQIITSLETKGYIVREMDKNDRRNIKIRLTELALPFMKNVTKKHIELHENVLKHISEDTRDSVLVAMEELLKSMNSWSNNKD